MVELFQAALTPVVAFIAVGIAFAQWWTARKKFKLDMFDRRWAVYNAARDLLAEMTRNGNVRPNAQAAFAEGTRGARWLLSQQVADYLHSDLWLHAAALQAANANDDEEARAEVMKWLSNQYAALDTLFDPFLRMDESFFALLRQRLPWSPTAKWKRAERKR